MTASAETELQFRLPVAIVPLKYFSASSRGGQASLAQGVELACGEVRPQPLLPSASNDDFAAKAELTRRLFAGKSHRDPHRDSAKSPHAVASPIATPQTIVPATPKAIQSLSSTTSA